MWSSHVNFQRHSPNRRAERVVEVAGSNEAAGVDLATIGQPQRVAPIIPYKLRWCTCTAGAIHASQLLAVQAPHISVSDADA